MTTKTNTPKLAPQTPLERNVARWINARAKEYGNGIGIEGVMSDLSHGCSSGIVGHLIYYKDTVAFYRKHRAEIDALLTELINDTGSGSPSGLFGKNWDNDDFFAREEANQNLLAWFGFEETARLLCVRAGIEV